VERAGARSSWSAVAYDGDTHALIGDTHGARERFEVIFRFYSPEKPLFDKTWVLPDIEKVG
jgi:hypothetical protein